MSEIRDSITELIGHTPLLRLNGYIKKHHLQADLLVKLEYFNPTGSVKDRIAENMIAEAEKSGKLKPGCTIVETTSGNTGISLAALAAAKGYHLRLYMQDGVSKERETMIRAYGAELLYMSQVPELAKVGAETDGDFVAVVAELRHLLEKEENVFFIDQVSNAANPQAHEKTTGPEIWEDTRGEVDVLAACVGTGGTVSGTGRYLKSKNPKLRVIAVEPSPDSVADMAHPNVAEITGVHRFYQIAPERIPQTLDQQVYDEVLDVQTAQAHETARELAGTDGILLGTSSGAAVFAAIREAKKPENLGKRIVAVAADTGMRYLSTNLYTEAK